MQGSITMKISFGKLDLVNRFMLVAMIFFIPISTALTNITLGLIALFWLLDNFSDQFRRWVLVLKFNPVAFMGLVVFLIHVVGVFYSNGEKDRVLESINDGAKFLFISMAMIYFKDKKTYTAFLFSFCLAMSITLILSYLLWVEMLPKFIPVKGSPLDCSIFHDHIKQNIFMAYMTFISAVQAKNEDGMSGKRIGWGIISLLSLFNVIFMVAGRTGHLVMGVLFLYFFISWGRIKGVIVAGLVLLFLGVSAWLIPTNSFFLRAKTVIEEINAWDYGKKASGQSSSGLRLEFYTNTIKIIKENPIFGTGTGSFEKSYKNSLEKTGMNPTDNPHNEYLMTAAQFGFVGLAALLGFFLVQWRNAGLLEDKYHTVMARGFILTILFSAMVSSPLQDNAEGWFFALMSAFLFSGSDTLRVHEKKRIEIA